MATFERVKFDSINIDMNNDLFNLDLSMDNIKFSRTKSNGSISSLSNLSTVNPTIRTPPNEINESKTTKTTNSRLQKLYKQSQELSGLKSKLLKIKKTNFIKRLCALSIIENGKVAYKLFIDSEQERAFNFLQQTFEDKSIDLYHQYRQQQHGGAIYKIFDLMEMRFTLFIKPIHGNEKFITMLLKNKQNINEIKAFRTMDILQTLIGEIINSLQQKTPNPTTKKAEMCSSASALIEIAEEVFGGGSEYLMLDEGEFITSMNVRLGMESIWYEHAKETLSDLFYSIVESIVDKQHLYARGIAAINFYQFVHYFNEQSLDKNACKIWNDIKSAIHFSPLFKRNKAMREKMDICVIKTKEKLNKLENLINCLEEIIIFDENLKKDEMVFWRNKILKNRQIIRLFQDGILTQILEQNEKLKNRVNDLMQMQAVAKKKRDNNELHEIETKYYELLKQRKKDQLAMKECELLIKEKDDTIYELKSKLTLMNVKHRNSKSINSVIDDDAIAISELRGEIAQKKLYVTRQLNAMRINMNDSVKT